MRVRLLIVALILVIALGTAGVVRARTRRVRAADKNAPLVVTTTAKRQDLLVTITQTGLVAAKHATPIIPEISGRAQWVCANGIIVKEADTVLRLDPTTFQETLADVNVRFDEALLSQDTARTVQTARGKRCNSA